MRCVVLGLLLFTVFIPRFAKCESLTQPGVVVAVDTSRSLKLTELQAAAKELQEGVRGLPAGTPVGVLTFNDSPQWNLPLPGTQNEALETLDRLTTAGHFTLLQDALITASQALPQGGVILLATDGRDENSAVTLEDVAQICRESHVRLVILGTGARVANRDLKRLALLTEGQFLGPAGQGADIATALQEALNKTPTPSTLPRENPQPNSVVVPTSPPSPPTQSTEPTPQWLLPLLLTLAALSILTLILVWIRSRRNKPHHCERCGSTVASWDNECPRCQIEELREALMAEESAPVAEEIPLDPSVFEKVPLSEALEKTTVLREQAVLMVKEKGKPPRTFLLHQDKAFAVGRAQRINTLAVDDRSLSAQHFKIVPKDGQFYLVDLGSTNGTLLGGKKVHAKVLSPGDTIRAGQIEFEFRAQAQRLT